MAGLFPRALRFCRVGVTFSKFSCMQDMEAWLFEFKYFHLQDVGCFPKRGNNQSFRDDKLAVGFRDAGFLASLSLRAWSLSLALGPSNTVQGFPSSPQCLLQQAPSATPCVSFPMNDTHLDYLQTGPHGHLPLGDWPSQILVWNYCI